MILHSNSIDLVIFDCDGVLIDSEVISAQVIVDMLALEGVLIDLDYVYTHFLGRPFSCVGQIVMQEFSVDLPESFESNYRQELLLAYKKGLRTTDGVKEVLSNLGVASCVVTSSSRLRTKGALQLVELTDFFADNIFTASDVTHGKPAPDLFLLASQRMQVEPKNCLVIEDSLIGISAAVAADMNVWRYTGARHFISTAIDVVDQFPHVTVFNDWRNFFQMAPDLQKLNMAVGDQNDY